MSEWGAGREPEPSRNKGPHPVHPGTDAVPVEAAPAPADEAPAERERGIDPIGVAAVAVGLLGIVVFGILAAIVAAILGSIAGQRAREAGRSLETAYLAFILAAVDGVVWLALHLIFDIAIQVG